MLREKGRWQRKIILCFLDALCIVHRIQFDSHGVDPDQDREIVAKILGLESDAVYKGDGAGSVRRRSSYIKVLLHLEQAQCAHISSDRARCLGQRLVK